MRWIFALLLSLFLALQYELWFGNRGLVSSHRLTQKTNVVERKTQEIAHENALLTDKIKRVKTSKKLVESYARRDLGMIKDGEVFYRYDKTK